MGSRATPSTDPKAGNEEKSLVDVFYRRANWAIDLPYEFGGYQYSERDFGIVEFTIVQEQGLGQ